MTLPMLVPATTSTRTPASASTLRTPMCASPRAAPPERARPTRWALNRAGSAALSTSNATKAGSRERGAGPSERRLASMREISLPDRDLGLFAMDLDTRRKVPLPAPRSRLLLYRKHALTPPAAQCRRLAGERDAFTTARTHGVARTETAPGPCRPAHIDDGPAGRRSARDVDVGTGHQHRPLMDIHDHFELGDTQDTIPGTTAERSVVLRPEPGPLDGEGGTDCGHNRRPRRVGPSPRTGRARGSAA